MHHLGNLQNQESSFDQLMGSGIIAKIEIPSLVGLAKLSN